ncbi:MAG: carbohydrate-binding family 9-like protein [Verrucomicrobiota bacterium]
MLSCLVSWLALGQPAASRLPCDPDSATRYTAYRASGPVLIDGHLNEAAWANAPASAPFVDLVSGRPVRWNTRVRLLWDDENLYLAYEVEEPRVRGDLTHHNDPLYSENDVEFFLAGDDAYYELEVNARNTLYEAFFIWESAYVSGGFSASPEFPRSQLQGFDGVGFHGHPRGGRLGHFNWRFPGIRSAVQIRGTLNHDQDQDRGWTVEISLPWRGMEWLAKAGNRALPPRDGDEWRMDFSRFNTVKEPPPAKDSGGWALSPHGIWDSHIPECFARVRFSSATRDPAVHSGPPPGVILAHASPRSREYLGSPSIAKMPDGSLVASHDFFGPGSTSDTIHVYGSTDGGRTWQRRGETQGFWSSLFVHRGALYLLGTSRQDGWITIRRSPDGGRTWTSPTNAATGLIRSDGRYHCAAVPVVEHGGRLWRSMEDAMGPGGWAAYFNSFVMSIPVDADLLNAANWTLSNRLPRDPQWLDGKFGGWLEGSVVVTPGGGLANVLRVDYRDPDEKAAMVSVSADGRTVRFDPAEGFMAFPGGCKKFAIRQDPKDGSYWSLANWIPPQQRGGAVDRIRNTLALIHSTDLRHWEVRLVLLQHPDRERHGFQYADFLFDGEDLLGLVRTAFDDSDGGAPSAHDANYITFHRWPGFRTLRGTEPR